LETEISKRDSLIQFSETSIDSDELEIPELLSSIKCAPALKK
jgi:hypothetical protein